MPTTSKGWYGLGAFLGLLWALMFHPVELGCLFVIVLVATLLGLTVIVLLVASLWPYVLLAIAFFVALSLAKYSWARRMAQKANTPVRGRVHAPPPPRMDAATGAAETGSEKDGPPAL
ncbi:MAG: hypothetical protein HUU14_08205 [Dehalococcoidia bacterium]|nr:hypothetical protein [Dehalococcoidia bacterium]MCL4231511.1 hypothetical protein [Dehalococcoidia bacterium]NUQ55854.1 hypothetical protein [Dehalococcoidia bacterium]